MKTTARFTSLALGISLLGGCLSPIDQRAQDGIHALDACDLRTADTAFADAFAMDETRSDIALAYALTELGVLAEDPALTAIAPRLGFDRPIDSSILWGHDGLLDRLSQHDSCSAVDELLHTRFPHPSARPSGPDFWSTVDPTLTLGDVRTTLVALSPRLQRISHAFEVAAHGMDANGVSLSGGCGISASPLRVQAPELLAAAAALEAARAGIQMALAYDGAMTVQLLFSHYQHEDALVAQLNAHALRVTDASQLEAGRPILEHAIALGQQAVTAARAIRTHQSDAAFDWTAMPVSVLDDVDAFGAAGASALTADAATATAIPRFSPALGIRIGSFFSRAYDMGAQGALWSVQTSSFGSPEITFDDHAFEDGFADRFDSNPWALGAPSRSFSIDWTFESSPTNPFSATFDPGMRWSHGFSCHSTTTP